jgi:hypothetical protein
MRQPLTALPEEAVEPTLVVPTKYYWRIRK